MITSRSAPLTLPKLGLGTFKSRGDDVTNAVTWALQYGIRHIDTASIYKNEQEIGLAIKEAIKSGTISSRRDIFITSKISPYEHGTKKAIKACEDILERLNLEYVDLVLIHWPGVSKLDPKSPENAVLRQQTWRVLESFYAKGHFKAIGVSNYELRHLEDLMTYAEILPRALQIECHPLCPQDELRLYCKERRIEFIAYSSLGAGHLLENELVKHIAERIQKTPAEVLLRWGLQKGCCVIPKSVNQSRIAEFAELLPLITALEQSIDTNKGRYLDGEAESALDDLCMDVDSRQKFCWDPAIVA